MIKYIYFTFSALFLINPLFSQRGPFYRVSSYAFVSTGDQKCFVLKVMYDESGNIVSLTQEDLRRKVKLTEQYQYEGGCLAKKITYQDSKIIRTKKISHVADCRRILEQEFDENGAPANYTFFTYAGHRLDSTTEFDRWSSIATFKRVYENGVLVKVLAQFKGRTETMTLKHSNKYGEVDQLVEINITATPGISETPYRVLIEYEQGPAKAESTSIIYYNFGHLVLDPASS